MTGLLYHFCRLQLPPVRLPEGKFQRHLGRTFELYRAKRAGRDRTCMAGDDAGASGGRPMVMLSHTPEVILPESSASAAAESRSSQ